MRVLHITPGIPQKYGGLTYALKNILELQRILGFESEVLTIARDGTEESIKKLAKVHCCKDSFPSRFLRSQQANVWLRENAKHFDLVEIHSIWGFVQMEAAHILHKQQIPFVIWPHGSLDPFDLQKKQLAKKILGPCFVRPIIKHSSSINCTSRLEAEKLEKYGAEAKVRALPLPIIPVAETNGRTKFRKKYGFSEHDFVLLFLSRIDYKKGLNLLIPAIARLSRQTPNLKLAIAGSASNGYETKVRKWLVEYKIVDKAVVCGFLDGDEKLDAFAGSDCFVLPSMNENFGISVVEALSAGLPVLISNNIYIWEEIVQKGGGWVCEYSVESLSSVISQVVNNPAVLQAKKNSAKQAALQFAPEVLAPLYSKLYQSITNHLDA